MSMGNSIDLEEEYDKIYRYCYYKLRSRETAEDITQEAFLRFFASDSYLDRGQALRYLYTIARNLCVDEWRRHKAEQPGEELEQVQMNGGTEEKMILAVSVRMAMEKLDEEERELILLRYANEVPVGVICKIYKLSRFTVYRKLKKAVAHLENLLGEEEVM